MSQQVKVYRELQFKAGAKSVGERKVLEAHTASDTLTFEESGSIHTNLGATAAVVLSLPQTGADGAVTGLAGVYYEFIVEAAYELRVDPGAAGAIWLDGTKGTDDYYITADDECESVLLVADGAGDWIAAHRVGTWALQT